jgi:hypothetical protein
MVATARSVPSGAYLKFLIFPFPNTASVCKFWIFSREMGLEDKRSGVLYASGVLVGVAVGVGVTVGRTYGIVGVSRTLALGVEVRVTCEPIWQAQTPNRVMMKTRVIFFMG